MLIVQKPGFRQSRAAVLEFLQGQSALFVSVWGPLRAHRVWCPLTPAPALWHFLSSMRLHTRKKTSRSSCLLFSLSLFLVTSRQNKVISKWEWTGASIYRWPVYWWLFLSATSDWYTDLWPLRFLLNFGKGQRAQIVLKYIPGITSVLGWEFVTCSGCRLAGSQPTHGGGSRVTKAEKDACSQTQSKTQEDNGRRAGKGWFLSESLR